MKTVVAFIEGEAAFPAAKASCNLFSGFVYGSGLVALAGAAGFSWIGMSGRLHD